MKDTQTLFTCTNCDAQFQKWTGRCLECGKWGTVEKSKVISPKSKVENEHATAKIQSLEDIQGNDVPRIDTRIAEVNRVLGGGIVPGSMILLGGEPGIGKSTLALQLATLVPKTLYISGEESTHQIKLRADRLQKSGSESGVTGYALRVTSSNISLANETNLDTIAATLGKEHPPLAIIDSIQTMWSADATGEPGNPNQIRACTTKLLEVAKSINTAILIIGHVTKDGTVAGPKLLEHLVDTVLYFEGERHHSYRILRAVKNRFGGTDEVGIFEMTASGLQEVANPSAAFLEERGEAMPGSVITCLMQGTRPMLVEVQALVNKTSFGYPARKASGFDINRLHVLTAVLEKRAGLQLGQYDIHVNVVGGLTADEPAADLAVSLAIASSYKDKVLGNDLAVFGEVGLGGEVRSVSFLDKRIKECAQLGMKRVITGVKASEISGVKIIRVKNIQELIQHA